MSEVVDKAAEPERSRPADDRHEGSGSSETPEERRNRNWAEILQELRVAQTGVQLLSAFLLALPFQNRFSTLSSGQEWLYLGVVALAISAMGLLVTPVSMHRAMFRKKEKENLVVVANRLAQAGLALFAVAVSGVVVLIFDVTKGFTAGVVAGVVTLVMFTVLWVAVPVAIRPLATAID